MNRYLVAARDLSTSEIIIKQAPLVIGPIANDDNTPVCLNCYRALEIDASYRYVNICACILWLHMTLVGKLSPSSRERNFLVNSLTVSQDGGMIERLWPTFTWFPLDARNVSFHSVPQSAQALITQRMSASSSSLGIFINICTGKRTELNCSMTTKLLRFWGKFSRVCGDGLIP